MIPPKRIHAIITEIHHVTASVYYFRFSCGDEIISFIPGQYVSLIIDATTRRQYSLCSAPQDLPFFDLVIDTAPMGPGSLYMLKRKVGDSVELLFPLGNFQLQQNSNTKVFVATGTGIAPFRSMIADQIARHHTEKISLFWGLRHEADVYWNDWFLQQAQQDAQFSYVLTLSKPDVSWHGDVGHVTEKIEKYHTDLSNTDFYLCGNKAMILDVTAFLQTHDVQENNIRTDMFF